MYNHRCIWLHIHMYMFKLYPFFGRFSTRTSPHIDWPRRFNSLSRFWIVYWHTHRYIQTDIIVHVQHTLRRPFLGGKRVRGGPLNRPFCCRFSTRTSPQIDRPKRFNVLSWLWVIIVYIFTDTHRDICIDISMYTMMDDISRYKSIAIHI